MKKISHILAIFDKFAAKAGCERPGPQSTAYRLFREIRPYLTEEDIKALHIAESHIGHEGRGELDEWAKKIRTRIIKENGKNK